MSPRNDTNCNLGPETVRDHSDRLVRIETKLDTLLGNMDVLFRKAETNAENIQKNSHAITVLQTEKTTAVALITAVGSALITIAGLLWSIFERHK